MIRFVLEGLSDEEFVLLLSISNPKITSKDNFRSETIVKSLPPKWKPLINVNEVCHALSNKGILSLYRPNNWRFENLGLRIASILRRFKATLGGVTRVQRRG